jgi:zinc/manganese transport system permease protein
LVYFVLGIIYFFIHKSLIEVSILKNSDHGKKKNIAIWDFIFYALLGILVTFAVRVAGVLLVFGFLIVPAVIGTLLGKSFLSKLGIRWITGVLVSLLGSYLSYILDFPTGGTVVVTLGLGLLFVALLRGVQLKFQ